MNAAKAGRGRTTRTKAVIVGALALVILVPAAAGFITKFVQFVRTMNSGEGSAFTILPMVNYLLVALGFVCLMAWAVLRGMFKDIEAPKVQMLEREFQIQEREQEAKE